MKLNNKLSVVASILLATSLSADTQDISVDAGWNLVGSEIDNVTIENVTGAENIKTAWAWDGDWRVYAPEYNIGSLVPLNEVNTGDGFWINAKNSTTITLEGVKGASVKALNSGWNLITFTGGAGEVSDVFGANNNIHTVWSYDNGWKAWSPSNAILTIIKNSSDVGVLESVSAGVGYWVQTQVATTVSTDLTPPEAVNKTIFVQNIGTDQTVVPVSDAELFVDGNSIGATDENGEFDFSALKLIDGTTVTVMKDGYTTNVGMISNGALVISIAPVDALENPPIVPTLAKKLSKTIQTAEVILASADGSQAPLKNKLLRTPSGDLVILDTSGVTQSVTGIATAYSYPEQVPTIENEIVLPESVEVNATVDMGKTVKPEELSIISGINISFKDVNGESIAPEDYNSLGLKYRVFAKNIIGDFEKIVTGLTGSSEDEKFVIDKETIDKFMDAKEKGLVSFYTLLQKADGTWEYLADAKITVTSSGTISLSVDNGGEILEDFGSGNIVFALRTESVMGTTTLCLDNGGVRMFDGNSIPSQEIGEPLEGAIIVGDEHVITQPAPTNTNGCTTIDYKVPFLSPMYQFTATKGDFYNKPITVDIEFGNLDTEINATMFEKPDAASIVGYVKSSIDGVDIQAEDDAIVTLRDPQILVPEKIEINDSEDNRSITLLTDKNEDQISFAWTLRKDDSSESVVISETNVLTQKAVEDVIYEANSPWLANNGSPYGHYTIDVVVTHTYSNSDENFVEAMKIDFDAKTDEVALKNAFEFSVNSDGAIYTQNPTTLEVNGTLDTTKNEHLDMLATDNIGIYAVYGGKEISKFKALKRAPKDGVELIDPDTKVWLNNVVATAPYGNESCIDINNPDVQNTPYLKDIIETNELIAIYTPEFAECTVKVLPQTTFEKSILPFSQVYKMFNDNYLAMLDIDSTNDLPWYKSGFTVLNTYKAINEAGDVNYLHYVDSTTDLKTGKFDSVNSFSNILNFMVSPNEAIAFDTRFDETDTDGSYRIDNIAPEVIPALELMARADGTKYNTQNFRRADYPDDIFDANVSELGEDEIPNIIQTINPGKVEDVKIGNVLVHNFMLDRIEFIEPTIENPVVEVPKTLMIDFENGLVDNTDSNWSVETLEVDGIDFNIDGDVKWQVVNNANLPTITDDYYINELYDGDSSLVDTILPTMYGENYAWMGNASTGTYDVDGYDKVVGTALKSPVIDFSNYSLATLSLKTWFEVSGIDSSWDTAFIGFEVQPDENQTAGSEDILVSWDGYEWPVTVGQTYIQRITPVDQIEWDYDNITTSFSNNGVNNLPSWAEYQLPLDFLAGKKAKVVFGFFTGDSLYNNMSGWGIDNIEITDNKDFVITTPPSVDEFESELKVIEVNQTIIIDNNETN